MEIKKIHYLSGLIISIFVGLHLFNHVWSIFGAERHIEIMNTLRLFYRHIFIESIIMLSVIVQIISGLKLFKSSRKTAISNFDKLHIWTGLYLAFFFIIHLSAVLSGRLLLHLDTNFYFGVEGFYPFPLAYFLFHIPAWQLHIASIHSKKMEKTVLV